MKPTKTSYRNGRLRVLGTLMPPLPFGAANGPGVEHRMLLAYRNRREQMAAAFADPDGLYEIVWSPRTNLWGKWRFHPAPAALDYFMRRPRRRTAA